MLSWYGICIAFGIICILFTVVTISYLVWNSKKLVAQIDGKWKNVRISSAKSNSTQLRAVRLPGQGTTLQLSLGGTVSSTSSVHPTKETWLNIQNSSQISTSNNTTERTTMSDLQDMFAKMPQEVGTSSHTDIAEGVYSTTVTMEKPSDSSA